MRLAAAGDSRSAVLAGAVIALSHSLDIQTVAEGIETPEQVERMRALGCTYGQGYFFARPAAGAEKQFGLGAAAQSGREAVVMPMPAARRAGRRDAPHAGPPVAVDPTAT